MQRMKKHLFILSITVLFALLIKTSYAQTVYENYVDGQIYFALKNNISYKAPPANNTTINIDQLPFLNSLFSKYTITALKAPFSVLNSDILKRTFHLHFTDVSKVDSIITELENNKEIEYAEKVPLHKISGFIPDDPFYNPTDQWFLYRIDAEGAWELAGDSIIKIAVVDNAVQVTHEDLFDNVYINEKEIINNGIDDDDNGYIDDIYGWSIDAGDNDPTPPSNVFPWDHGTHVAGIVSAITNNVTGVASIGNNKNRIIGIQSTLSGSSNPFGVDDPWSGVVYAAEIGVNVINMSLGGSSFSTTIQNLINAVYDAGIVIIAAAGNDNVQTNAYPAAYANVISVAATDSSDKKAWFSNYGSWVDISAPGTEMLSTSTYGNPKYQSYEGTSQAAPLVSGLCGLMLSVSPFINPGQIESCLKSSADDIEDILNSNHKGKMGAGRINAKRAMECVRELVQVNASIVGIELQNTSYCNGYISPMIRIKNEGPRTIDSIKIKYQFDDGTIYTDTWKQTLQQGDTGLVTLFYQAAMGINKKNIKVFIDKVNGFIDIDHQFDTLLADFCNIEENFSDEIKVYSSILDNRVFISFDLKTEASYIIEIFDELGNIIWETKGEKSFGGTLQVNLDDYAAHAMYFVRVQSGEMIGVRKFIL